MVARWALDRLFGHDGEPVLDLRRAIRRVRPGRRGRRGPQGGAPAWSPDGSLIAFAGGAVDAERGVYVMRPDGSGVRRVSTAEGSGDAFAATWSPDGRRLAFAAGDGRTSVWVVRVDGSDERRVDQGLFLGSASWSPDGTRLAWLHASVAIDGLDELDVADADGSNIRRFPHEGIPRQGLAYDGFSPCVGWSPDGATSSACSRPTAARSTASSRSIPTAAARSFCRRRACGPGPSSAWRLTTMDTDVLGRTRSDEVATLQELGAGPERVRPLDRRWLLALAGVAAIVCIGFLGDRPTATLTVRADPTGPAPAASAAAAPAAPRSFELLEPVEGTTVIGGVVPVGLSGPPGVRVHVAIELGASVLGWRNIALGPEGTWRGGVRVFAPRTAVPAVVRVSGVVDGRRAEVARSFSLAGGTPVVMWATRTVDVPGGRVVEVAGTAPLADGLVVVSVLDPGGKRLGAARLPVRVDADLPGSVGGAVLGIGGFAGCIRLSGPAPDPLLLRVARVDAGGARSAPERLVDPAPAMPER